MEETARVHAIVLDRKPFREHDLLVTVYSQERGREQLIARGARKFRSKIAAHVEPLCLIDGLIVIGKSKNYLGSAVSNNVFANTKNDLGRLSAVGRALVYFKTIVRDRETDNELFDILKDYLGVLDETELNSELLTDLFIFKLISHSGYGLDVYNCGACQKKLIAGSNKYDPITLKLVHEACGKDSLLTISDECVKVLRIVSDSSFKKIANISIISANQAPNLANEIANIIASLVKKTQI